MHQLTQYIVGIFLIGAIGGTTTIHASDAGAVGSQVVELRKAARNGDVDAAFRLGELFQTSKQGARADLSQAATWYANAASGGHTLAQRKLAEMHMSGQGVPQSFEEAKKHFFQAAQKNDEESQYQLGLLLVSGRGGSMSVDTATQWFEKSAKAGHAGAQLELGKLYLTGTYVEKNSETAFRWIRKSASQDHTPSMFLLARIYEDGELVPENPDKARSYYSKAADNGLAAAQVWIGGFFERKDPPQYRKALRFYKRAAKQHNADGHYGVARLNLERLLQTPNSQEGLRHLRAAISLQHPEAHYTIGRMYGSGVLSGGSAKALGHFQQAANLGHAPSMYELGVAYYNGTSPVKTSPKLAVQWWRRASASGHIDSLYAFSLLYLSGLGVAKDPKTAFALINIAAAHGHDGAIRVRDELLVNLSPEVLRDAQDMSVDLFQQYAFEDSDTVRSRLK